MLFSLLVWCSFSIYNIIGRFKWQYAVIETKWKKTKTKSYFYVCLSMVSKKKPTFYNVIRELKIVIVVCVHKCNIDGRVRRSFAPLTFGSLQAVAVSRILSTTAAEIFNISFAHWMLPVGNWLMVCRFYGIFFFFDSFVLVPIWIKCIRNPRKYPYEIWHMSNRFVHWNEPKFKFVTPKFDINRPHLQMIRSLS